MSYFLMKYTKILRDFYVLTAAFFSFCVQAQALEVPDKETHKSFLLETWKPEKPSLVVFKDPSCPYCVRDLKKRAQLQNYNVFLFWSPILGERSLDHVNTFFKCPSSSDQIVLDAVIERVKPVCDGEFKQKEFNLNKKMAENYSPNSVPQYWLGGRQVGLTSLKLSQSIIDAESVISASPIKIDWSRYGVSAVNKPKTSRHNVGIVLPENTRLTEQAMSLLAKNTRYNWYLFVDRTGDQGFSELWCTHKALVCTKKTMTKFEKNNKEFKLLTGLSNSTKTQYVFEGKTLLNAEKKYLIPKMIIAATTPNSEG